MNGEAFCGISLYEIHCLKINYNCDSCFRFVLGKLNVTGINSSDFTDGVLLSDSIGRTEQLTLAEQHGTSERQGKSREELRYTDILHLIRGCNVILE